jgi:CDP-diacylglycerol--glycerol-3-phosphate 3-phosphatidyltransferase
VIIGREIVISALREWMAEMNRRGVVKVNWIGRVKTTLQMIAIVVLLAQPPSFQQPWVVAGYAMLHAAALLTLWTMVLYLRAAWPTLRSGFVQR